MFVNFERIARFVKRLAGVHEVVRSDVSDAALSTSQRNALSGVRLVGFDSAWADRAPGAICSINFDGRQFCDFMPPRLVKFNQARYFIDERCDADIPNIIAIDQPTIVTNQTGFRPVEKVARDLIAWLGGGVQPGNLSNSRFFGDMAPIGLFLRAINAEQNPEKARTATKGVHVIEVFPALTLPSLDDAFYGFRKGPRYNPARQTFRLESWNAVIAAAHARALVLGLGELAAWLAAELPTSRATKHHQDLLDSAICLLIAVQWRLGERRGSILLGDAETGFMVSPVSKLVRAHLEKAAGRYGVPIDSELHPV